MLKNEGGVPVYGVLRFLPKFWGALYYNCAEWFGALANSWSPLCLSLSHAQALSCCILLGWSMYTAFILKHLSSLRSGYHPHHQDVSSCLWDKQTLPEHIGYFNLVPPCLQATARWLKGLHKSLERDTCGSTPSNPLWYQICPILFIL